MNPETEVKGVDWSSIAMVVLTLAVLAAMIYSLSRGPWTLQAASERSRQSQNLAFPAQAVEKP